MYEIKDIDFNGQVRGRQIYIEANPELGFNNPYVIFIPEVLKYMTLLVNPINTGKAARSLDDARKDNLVEVNKGRFSMKIANDLGMPLLTPLFPRITGYNTHMLTSLVYNNDIRMLIEMNKYRDSENQLTEEEILEIQKICFDIPKQLISIINKSREVLKDFDIDISSKVIVEGYSAAGKFVNYFTSLYPNIVKASISGGNCGLGILPIDRLNDTILKYPLGVADISNFDLEEFLKVPQLFYIGDNDYNDPAMVKCNYVKDSDGNYIKDEDGYFIPEKDYIGKIIPVLSTDGRIQSEYPDCYTDQEVEIIQKLLGSNPQERFNNQEQLYKKLRVNALFKRLSGTHKTIFKNHTLIIESLIENFILSVLEEELKIVK